MMSTRPTSSHIDRILTARPPFRQALTLFVGLYIGGMIGKLVIDEQPITKINAFQQREDSPPGYLFDPVEIPTQCPRKKRRRVIDMTLVNSELSSLELRMNELWNVVDIFFIAESTVPFKPGAPSKSLHLTNHWVDFERFHSKMVLYVIPPEISRGTGAKVDLIDFRPNFKVQEAQRDDLWRHLKQKLNPHEDDLIIKADLDEIPRPSVIEKLACDPPGMLPRTPICLETKDSFYYYNYRCHIKNEWTGSPTILSSSEFESQRPSRPYYQLPCKTRIKNASIHCSSCFGSLDEFHAKSISNSEPIRNAALQTNNASILERVRSCKDFWLRTNEDETMELRPSVDAGSIPLIVSKHPERWPHLMGEGPLYETMHSDEQASGAKTNETQLTTTTEGSEIRVPICLTAQESCVRPYFPTPKTVTCPAKNNLQSSSTGAYILPENFTYRFDQQFANAILNKVVTGSVLELGAGLGCYTYYFSESGKLSQIHGYEGASNVHELSGGLVKRADLSEHHEFGQFDWVISLEVAEHIPAEFEATFVANLIAPKPKGIILSWALPDQPGSGHVNGKTNEYVISLMGAKGFEFDREKTLFLRSEAQLGWFKDTTMVFIAK
mmetsp:Transcript_29172/g.53804  ORF Transcript_29172/g.53804 Transcript_29172/m.53804 type:complete len:610 (-) Transcript_29172:287-2116(-)